MLLSISPGEMNVTSTLFLKKLFSREIVRGYE